MMKLIGFAFLAVMVVLIVQFPDTMLNPGILAEGHQSLNHNCFSCHQPFGGIDNNKCISCHELTEIGKDSLSNQIIGKEKILFHQNLSTTACTACHTDHAGMNANLTLSTFKHEILAENTRNNCVNCHQKPEDNLHAQISASCNSCHNTSDWKNTTDFNHNMLEASVKNNCTSCHKTPADAFHKSLKDNCIKCHSTEEWVPSSFDHSAYFLLDEDHNAKCSTCHLNNNYSAYTCYGCHEHTPANILAEHNEEGIYKINNCVACHKSASEGEGGEDGGDDD